MKKKIASQANPVRYFFALGGQEPPLLFGRLKSQRHTKHGHVDRRQVVGKIPRENRAGLKSFQTALIARGPDRLNSEQVHTENYSKSKDRNIVPSESDSIMVLPKKPRYRR